MIKISVFATATATIGKIKDGATGPKGATGSKGDKGDKGDTGAKGATGATLYMWVKYATTPTTGMSDSPEGKSYLGIAYNKTTATASTDYNDYSWIKVGS